MLSTINNKIAFCEHMSKTGVFHFSVLQLLNKLLHIKMSVGSQPLCIIIVWDAVLLEVGKCGSGKGMAFLTLIGRTPPLRE
jgi:hypothetical protein